MTEKTIIIKTRDKDNPLTIDSARLTKESSVFRHLINDLNLTEIELEDFDPDTVQLFMVLLADNTVIRVEDDQFRELHKLAVVFNVRSLMTKFRDWLEEKIHHMGNEAETLVLYYVFEESRFILDKWGLEKFLGIIISEFSSNDNAPFFKDYMANLDELKVSQLRILLLFAGSRPSQLLLNLTTDLEKMQGELSKNTRYLLQKINLAMLYEENPEIYLQLFEGLKRIPDLPITDLKFTIDLMTESNRQIYLRAQPPPSAILNLRKYGREFESYFENVRATNKIPATLDEIASEVSEGKIDDMLLVVILVARVCVRNQHQPSAEGAEIFVKTLVNLSKSGKNRRLKKISSDIITTVTDTLKHSKNPKKDHCISLLMDIKKCFSLTSYKDQVCLTGKKLWEWMNRPSVQETQSFLTRVKRNFILSLEEISRFVFVFKHPGVHNCDKPGKCGFIVEVKESEEVLLCVSSDEYRETGIHPHMIYSAEKMKYFHILEGIEIDGRQKTWVPNWWAFGSDWFPEFHKWKPHKFAILYDKKEYSAVKMKPIE